MLKQRIIATLIIKNDIVVQSIGFNRYLPVGRVDIAVEYLNKWGVDEIILLDIDASKNHSCINTELVKKASTLCFAPLCVGGGIVEVEDIKRLLSSGADKVSINQAFLHRPDFLLDAASTFGSQCIVITLDIKKVGNTYMVYDYIKKKIISTLQECLHKAQRYRAGEILLHCVDRDGAKSGYDLELLDFAGSICDLPILLLGGAKDANDILSALKNPFLSGACAANFFHYFEHSVNITKAYIKANNNFPIRHDNYINYHEFNFEKDTRIKKRQDKELQNLFFKIQEKELI